MKVLVLNSWSSSLKYQVLTMPEGDVACEWLVERVWIGWSMFTVKVNGNKIKLNKDVANHKEALDVVIEMLLNGETKVLNDISEINAVGHRVLHWGEIYKDSVVIDDEVMKTLNDLTPLGPLHMPPNMMGINAISEILPGVPNVAVFDTAFHQSMKPENFMYALPYEYYEKYGVRRYGFHGTSHKYVTSRVCEILGKDYASTRIINCHVGNGASVCAVADGRVVDTSMWFTPLEGLVMGTRSWDLDPAVIKFIANTEGKSINEIDDILNKKSGILGVSGISSDLREVIKASNDGDKRSKIAIEMLCNRIKKYLCSYAGLMGGVDAICFTAGIGENSDLIREKVCENLEFMGIEIDTEANKIRKSGIREIQKEGSKTKIFIIPTNEELVITKDTYNLVKAK